VGDEDEVYIASLPEFWSLRSTSWFQHMLKPCKITQEVLETLVKGYQVKKTTTSTTSARILDNGLGLLSQVKRYPSGTDFEAILLLCESSLEYFRDRPFF